MSEPLRLAYLTSLYARPSDTFVRSEVDRLRAAGVQVDTFSIRRPQIDATVDPNVAAHQTNTVYLLEAGLARLLLAALQVFLKHPIRFSQTKLLAWRTCSPGIRLWLLQVVYLCEAAYLSQLLRQRRIQHLHNHIGENSATVAMLAAHMAGIPYSLTIHGPGIFTAPKQWALGTKLDRAAFTACISSFCRSQCMMYAKPETWSRLHVVRCAVSEQFLEPAERPADEAPPVFTCIGRLCVDKAQRVLVQAAAKLHKLGLEFRLILVGDGPEREPIESLIKSEGLDDIVTITGWQSSQEIRELLLRTRAMTLPSFAEGLPIVIMESMALECPAISTNVGAISELVVPGETGWLVPPGDVESLVDAMQEAAELPAQSIQAMGRRGREKVLQHHQPQHQADQLIKLFATSARHEF